MPVNEKMNLGFFFTHSLILLVQMNSYRIYDLPIEMLHLIASIDVQIYRAMLAMPLFSRSLGPGVIVDFMIAFGYTVEINNMRTVWCLSGICHRVDGPAIEQIDGSKVWYLNGSIHRSDGPAIEKSNGDKVWCRYGMTHRMANDDGSVSPAMEYANGDKAWYLSDVLHRVDGPAIELANGDKEWWFHGMRHRQPDCSGAPVGPAVEYEGGHKRWYLNGRCVADSKICVSGGGIIDYD
jgi:hypothetical protein